ncbi:prepilin peptidase [Pseudoduganella sp. GCM10020061]|jgi:prepilin peptidase CpaA|uniref:A24 family peptidase n=1 Tax=Pseudoduganella sp. GCM10020061 TaxID=3317345 RepID=UPI003631AB07
MTLPIALLVPLGLLVVLAAGRDLAERTIPNRLIAAALALAFVLQLWLAPAGWLMFLAGALTGFLLFLPMYLLGGMGAGDVKLMLAIGAFAGPGLTLQIAAASCIAGGGLSLGYLSAPRTSAKSHMPYGPAIAMGTATVLAYRFANVI